MEKGNKKASFPHMGNYFVCFRPIVELITDQVIVPPPITKKTLEIGAKYGPESACIPFKYNLGNYIEALELGANVLVQAGGGCRFGYYGEVQKEILKKLGYKFDFIKLNNNYFRAITEIRKINPKISYVKIFKTVFLSYFRIRAIDSTEDVVRKNIGFQKNKGEYEKFYKIFLAELGNTRNIKEVTACKNKYLQIFKNIEIKKPSNPIRVGVIGELYVLMEPFSNFYIEKELAQKGIEVHRFVTVSSILHDGFSFNMHLRKFQKEARPYLRYHIGAHGTESVARALQLIKSGFDGIIHIKPFGCMPEVNAMSVLHNISKDYKIPIVYFSFDSQTSEAGIKTRIEAFHDMLLAKRKARKLINSNIYESR
jgi:predicted nucleotide-binding protein (sugar kinase/HSP70/actin superfamily)